MLTPLADVPRLHLHVVEVIRRQAAEAALFGREPHIEPDLMDALEGMVRRVRDTASALGLAHVERAAQRALRGLAGEQRSELLDELLDTCTGGRRATPLLRPLVVLASGPEASSLHKASEAMASTSRIVPDLLTAEQAAETEDASAVVVPVEVLGRPDAGWLRRRLVFAYGRDSDLTARAVAARAGAVHFFPEPLELRDVVRAVRQRLAAWRQTAWRVVVIDKTRDRAEEMCASLACGELVPIAAVGGGRLLAAVEALGPDLIVLAGPVDGFSLDELVGVLRAHHRLSRVPRMVLWEGESAPPSLARQYVVPRGCEPAELRARALARLDERRHEAALREHDDLTCALSAAAILNAADRECALARRRNEPLSAARFELDDVAEIERTAGPVGRDRALRLLAQTLLTGVRETDCLGVAGSSGLILVLPGSTGAQMRERVGMLHARFNQRIAAEEGLTGVTVSVGLADGAEDLLLRAERALLRAQVLSAEGRSAAAGLAGGVGSSEE